MALWPGEVAEMVKVLSEVVPLFFLRLISPRPLDCTPTLTVMAPPTLVTFPGELLRHIIEDCAPEPARDSFKDRRRALLGLATLHSTFARPVQAALLSHLELNCSERRVKRLLEAEGAEERLGTLVKSVSVRSRAGSEEEAQLLRLCKNVREVWLGYEPDQGVFAVLPELPSGCSSTVALTDITDKFFLRRAGTATASQP